MELEARREVRNWRASRRNCLRVLPLAPYLRAKPTTTKPDSPAAAESHRFDARLRLMHKRQRARGSPMAGKTQTTMDVALYTDPANYARERTRIFARSWLVIGHESQFPKAGSIVA